MRPRVWIFAAAFESPQIAICDLCYLDVDRCPWAKLGLLLEKPPVLFLMDISKQLRGCYWTAHANDSELTTC